VQSFFTAFRSAENLGLKNEPNVWRGLIAVKSKPASRGGPSGSVIDLRAPKASLTEIRRGAPEALLLK
jgi:hypothetical protein